MSTNPTTMNAVIFFVGLFYCFYFAVGLTVVWQIYCAGTCSGGFHPPWGWGPLVGPIPVPVPKHLQTAAARTALHAHEYDVAEGQTLI